MSNQGDLLRAINDLQRRVGELERRESGGGVGLTGNQTIAGVKTFSNGISFGNEAITIFDAGSWTPSLSADSPGTMAITYTFQVGTYTRLNNIVWFNIQIRIATFSLGTASGNLRVSLPFVSDSNGGRSQGIVYAQGVNFPGTPVSLSFGATAGVAYGYIYTMQQNAGATLLTPGGLGSGDDIWISGFYFV